MRILLEFFFKRKLNFILLLESKSDSSFYFRTYANLKKHYVDLSNLKQCGHLVCTDCMLKCLKMIPVQKLSRLMMNRLIHAVRCQKRRELHYVGSLERSILGKKAKVSELSRKVTIFSHVLLENSFLSSTRITVFIFFLI